TRRGPGPLGCRGRTSRPLPPAADHPRRGGGAARDDTDQDLAALELHSLAEGLALQLGSDPGATASRAALALVSARVQAAFPGRCRQYE
ncbi:hypothetical protein ACFWJY_40075, partial [Streptomyces anulatus]|uniref:hypothetical protein n=1 Tax=Streptomyces anulatus TaxID=1892 RepID=UPI003663CCB3